MAQSDYISRDKIAHVLAALTPANRLVCYVALHTGLRVDDVLSIKTEQLCADFRVKEQKTGKTVRVRLPQDLLRELKAQAGRVYVFEHRTDESRHRTRQAVFVDMKRAAKAFRFRENLSPHSMRKFYAVELMRKHGNLKKVQKALNHSNELVTMIYAYADMLPDLRKF